MAVLRSLLFNLGFFAWTLLIAVLGVPCLLLPYRLVARPSWTCECDAND